MSPIRGEASCETAERVRFCFRPMKKEDSEILWYVVFTKPQKELQVVSLLEEKQLVVFLPEVYQKYRNKVQLRPLFPRYLFVQMDLDQVELGTINYTPGVIRVVSNEETPLPLRNEVIEAIREEVKRLNERGGLPTEEFKEGERVRLRSGPLAGMEAVFLKHLTPRDRAIVLLRFLGQENQVEIDISEIEPKRRRGTRGRGRKIHYKDKKNDRERSAIAENRKSSGPDRHHRAGLCGAAVGGGVRQKRFPGHRR